MAKSYDQPVLNANNIIISDARIMLKTYSSSYQFPGNAPIDLDNPPAGFVDAGLISQAALNITKDEVKLEVGLPKNTVKTAERSREVTVSFNFSELGAETVALITGANKYNVLVAATLSSASTTAHVTANARFASQFSVNDKVITIDTGTGDIEVPLDEAQVSDVTGATVTTTAFTDATASGDVLARAGSVVSVAQDGDGNDVVTVTTGHGDRFVAGDFFTYATPAGTAALTLQALRESTERLQVKSVATDAVTFNGNFTTAPSAGDILCAYNSVELVDELGSQIRRTLLMFFDYQDDQGNDFQYCLYFPKVKATGAFSPDFKGGENYADVPAGFSAEAVSLLMADNTTQRVLVIPYVFAV